MNETFVRLHDRYSERRGSFELIADAKRVSCSRLGLWAAADPCAAIRADPPGNRAPAVGFALERARLDPRELEGGARHNQRH
jgi:hypothetical protein